MSHEQDYWAKQGALRMARTIEMDRRRQELETAKIVQPFDMLPAPHFFDGDSGRRELTPDAPLIHVGRYFRRSRAYAGISQMQLAGQASVSQSMVSRVERARAPGMALERFVDMCLVLGRLFPFGVCPHDHHCGWQPIPASTRQQTQRASWSCYCARQARRDACRAPCASPDSIHSAGIVSRIGG